MTRQELEQQYLVVDNMTFTPRYECKQIKNIENGEIVFIDDYTITATAQEVYAEWQAQQNNSTPLASVEQRITNIESYLVDQVEKQYMEVINNV